MGRKSAVLAKARNFPLPEPREAFEAQDADASGTDNSDPGDGTEDSLATEIEVSDNVGEQSIEINVETLIAELEAESHKGRRPDVHSARRKLEDYLERKRVAHDIEDFEDFEIDDQE